MFSGHSEPLREAGSRPRRNRRDCGGGGARLLRAIGCIRTNGKMMSLREE